MRVCLTLSALVGSCMGLTCLPQPDARRFYVSNSAGIANNPGESVLFTVNPSTGSGTSTGTLHIANETENSVAGVTLSPDGRLFAIDVGSQKLLAIDLSTLSIQVMGVLGDWDNERVIDLAFSPAGDLYGYDERLDSLITINPATGRSVAVNPGALPDLGAIAFRQDGTLFGARWQPTNTLITIDVSTGEADQTIGTLAYANASGCQLALTGLCFAEDGRLYGVSSGLGIGVFPAVIDENFVEVDPATAQVTLIGTCSRLGDQGYRDPKGLAIVP